jgi:hypothetical protein
VTPYESRLIELADNLQAALDQLREHIRAGAPAAEDAALASFADEVERAQDA